MVRVHSREASRLIGTSHITLRGPFSKLQRNYQIIALFTSLPLREQNSL